MRDGAIRYSVVSAVCNVARYLDRFFESIVSQPLFAQGAIEIVAVEDSSTDESGDVLERWQSRYPDRIRVVRGESSDVSTARNVGQALGRGDWVTFADPDDYVSPGYFAAIDAAIAHYAEKDLALLASKIVYYLESDRSVRDTHPLGFRFAEGERAVRIADLGKAIHYNVMSSFFRRSLIEAMDLRFDPLVKPGFEDGHYLGRYLSRFRQKAIALVPDAVYFYRKRADKTSLSGAFAGDPRRYTSQLRFGQIGLLKEVAASGPVPLFMQNLVLYSISYICGHIVSQPATVAFLTADQRRECTELIGAIADYIEPSVIADFDLVDGSYPFRVGLLGSFKGMDAPFAAFQVAARRHDQMILLTWSRGPKVAVSFAVNDVPANPLQRQSRALSFFDRPFCWEHATWLKVRDGDRIRAFVDGREASIRFNGRSAAGGITVPVVRPAA